MDKKNQEWSLITPHLPPMVKRRKYYSYHEEIVYV